MPPPPSQEKPRRNWSFRRFGADDRAQAMTDTWDELQSVPLPILDRLTSHHRDLYQSEQVLHERSQAVFQDPSSPHQQHHTLSRKDASALVKETKQAAARVLTTLNVVDQTQGSFDVDIDGEENKTMYIQMQRAEFVALQEELRRFVKGSSQLASHCESVLKVSNEARTALGRELETIRSFITTIWSINAENAKAFPPFLDLGILDASLYGIGNAQPPPPAAAASETTSSQQRERS